MGHEPGIGSRCCSTCSKITSFSHEKTRLTTTSSPHPCTPCVHSKTSPVYASTTRTCVSTCARGAGIHGDVLNVHTETFSAFHTTPHRTHHNTRHNTHDTTHNTNNKRRQRKKTERERGREDGREEDKTRRREKDKTRQDEERREKR